MNNYYSGYNLLKSPFFYLPNVDVKSVYQDNEFKIYSPISGMCWNAPTPCSYRKKLDVINWNSFKIILKKND